MKPNFYLECSACDEKLLAPFSTVRNAIRWAEDQHQWLSLGVAAQHGFLCPKHEIPCARCERPLSTEIELAARRNIRAKIADRKKS